MGAVCKLPLLEFVCGKQIYPIGADSTFANLNRPFLVMKLPFEKYLKLAAELSLMKNLLFMIFNRKGCALK